MNLTDIATTRYATKKFDPLKKISKEHFTQIKSLLRFSPSSVNLQPWHFIIADTKEGKRRVIKGTQGTFSSNEPKVMNASHVIVFCAKTHIDDDYLNHVLEVEEKHGRFEKDPSFKLAMNAGRSFYVNMHRYDLKDAQHWMEKQVYLNMGTILLGAGVLGIDAVPIEGMDPKALNEEFGLLEKGFCAVSIIALGYKQEGDFNAELPKSRLEEEEIFTELD